MITVKMRNMYLRCLPETNSESKLISRNLARRFLNHGYTDHSLLKYRKSESKLRCLTLVETVRMKVNLH